MPPLTVRKSIAKEDVEAPKGFTAYSHKSYPGNYLSIKPKKQSILDRIWTKVVIVVFVLGVTGFIAALVAYVYSVR